MKRTLYYLARFKSGITQTFVLTTETRVQREVLSYG
jgi:hypothetical protein